uniref:Reverse transcriptase domain-containing protein n=1 Tax=Peronospora matthiolae TaxID=2874970 RepID=A0AAV1V694_9STRA
MVPALVAIGNQILAGADLPPSFLSASIIPLMKKGDSDDAMDYRPISLLQTGYKVFAKVLATRVQVCLPRTISDSQQGFVHGRRMTKTVMMMMAQLTTATEQIDLTAEDSRCILLLDFRKAYDTVDRDFLYESMRLFGFTESFVDLICRIHTGTTATFVVNGGQSSALPVRSGIRQGCPLAPLLFLLVVEVLGLALKQDPSLKGLPVPGTVDRTHLFSAFVDDSTLFLDTEKQILHALGIIQAFGNLSGLHVQPAKSKLLFLNRAISRASFAGIDIVPSGATTRYLGYEIGTGPLDNKNWAHRIRTIQRRLLTATRVATSVENRVLILNSIVLPSLLFTASVFYVPRWAEKEVHNSYKNFLWEHATVTDKKAATRSTQAC